METKKTIVEESANPSPEVLEKPVRRRFSVEYKLKILAEADACVKTGQLGELLRRGDFTRRTCPTGEGNERQAPWPA